MGEYYKTKESVSEYIKLAAEVNGKGLIEKFKTVLSKGSKVLEIGSGPGTDWEILSQDFVTTGSDNSNEFLEHLRKNNENGKFLELDATSIGTNLKFDGIYSNKVMHHLTDEDLKKSVKRQSEVLNKKGVICHSFWAGEGSEIFKGLFVNYHSDSDIQNYFDEHFKIVSIEPYTEFDEGDSILIIATKR